MAKKLPSRYSWYKATPVPFGSSGVPAARKSIRVDDKEVANVNDEGAVGAVSSPGPKLTVVIEFPDGVDSAPIPGLPDVIDESVIAA